MSCTLVCSKPEFPISTVSLRENLSRAALGKILSIAPEAPLVFDALYKDHDEEYLDAKYIREIVTRQGS
jgi:hypothetical protein